MCLQVLREAMPPKCELMAVVKAQAYGHGMYEIAAHLDRIGVRAFAVDHRVNTVDKKRYIAQPDMAFSPKRQQAVWTQEKRAAQGRRQGVH